MDSVKFSLGEMVYMRIKPDTLGIVSGILFRPNVVWYYVTWSNDMQERGHSDIELTTEKAFKPDPC